MITPLSTHTSIRIEERLSRLFEHLAIRRAHVAAGYAAEVVALASTSPEAIASLTLVSPFRFLAEPLRPLGARVLFFHGDRGPNASTGQRAAASLPEARVVVLQDYSDAGWSDTVADRQSEIEPAMLAFLDDMSRQEDIAPLAISEGSGEVEGITYRVRGSGPPLVIFPLNLARSQWEPLLPALAEHYSTIVLGGAHIGFVLSLEERMRGGYRGVVRGLFDALAVQPDETLLEVGCGPGAVARWLASTTAGANPITAVDVNRYLLHEAEAASRSEGVGDRITFQHGDAEALPFASGSFDVTLSVTVMEEVDADRMLAELIRVTKPGGRIGVVVRATDMPLWMNLDLSPELRARIDAAPRAGAEERGCADASLYRRFRAAGLTDLRMGPQLGANQPEAGSSLFAAFSTRILQGLDAHDAQQFRAAVARAVDDGTLVWAEPYHCAVGTVQAPTHSSA
jgi:SAM-dependent methyltransferase